MKIPKLTACEAAIGSTSPLVLVLLAGLAPGAAMAQSYTVTNLGNLGGRNTYAYAINAAGEVVGTGEIKGNAYQHAFVSDGNSIKDLGTLVGVADSDSVGSAINSQGRVAGDSGFPNAPNFAWAHAFITSDDGALVDLGSLGGALLSVAGVNDSGQVTGWSYIATSGQHAFVTVGTTMIDLGTLGGDNSYAAAINDGGQVVGDSFLPDEQNAHAFITQDNKMIDLGTLGGASSIAVAINARGEVTGYADTATGAPHAFITHGKNMIDLGTLGGETSQGMAINQRGQVTGIADTAATGSTHAFITQGLKIVDLGTLGGTFSEGLSINAAGEVVGTSYTIENFAQHAFLFSRGKMIDLNSYLSTSEQSEYELSEAVAINADGLIVVNGVSRSNHASQAFLLRPVASSP